MTKQQQEKRCPGCSGLRAMLQPLCSQCGGTGWLSEQQQEITALVERLRFIGNLLAVEGYRALPCGQCNRTAVMGVNDLHSLFREAADALASERTAREQAERERDEKVAIIKAIGAEKDELRAKAEAARYRCAAAEHRATRIQLDKELLAERDALTQQVTALREALTAMQVAKDPSMTACDDGGPCWCGYNVGMGPTHSRVCLKARAALSASLPPAPATLGQSHSVTARERAEAEMGAYPIPLNDAQEKAALEWAADDRLWTTQETVEFNLRVFARVILSALPPAPEGK